MKIRSKYSTINYFVAVCFLITSSCGPSGADLYTDEMKIPDSVSHIDETMGVITGHMKDSILLYYKMQNDAKVYPDGGVDSLANDSSHTAIDTTVKVNPDQFIEEKANNLKGKLQHNIPSKMNIDEVYTISVAIKKDTNLSVKPIFEDSDAAITSIPVDKLLPAMKIVLVDKSTDAEDQNFQIKPINSFETQNISELEFTIWKFNVKAVKSGKHTLRIELSGCANKDDCKFIELKQIDVEIEASAIRPFVQFFKKNWPFICGTILIPLIVWLFKSWRSKKEKKTEVPSDVPKDMD